MGDLTVEVFFDAGFLSLHEILGARVRSGLADAGIVAFGSSRSGRDMKKRAREGSRGVSST